LAGGCGCVEAEGSPCREIVAVAGDRVAPVGQS